MCIRDSNISDYYHSHKLVDDLTALQCDVVKIAILNLNGTADHVYPFFEQFKDRYSMAVSAFEWMDIMMPGTVSYTHLMRSISSFINASA